MGDHDDELTHHPDGEHPLDPTGMQRQVRKRRGRARTAAERRQAVAAGEREYGVAALGNADVGGGRGHSLERLQGQAHWLGVGEPITQLLWTQDGRLFREAREGDRPHALWPRSSDRHPDGVPLVAVRLVDLTLDEYQAHMAQLPAPMRAEPSYHWRGPVGAGGHERTDGGGATAEGGG